MFKLAKKCEQSALMEVWWQQGEIRDTKGHFPHLFPSLSFFFHATYQLYNKIQEHMKKGHLVHG